MLNHYLFSHAKISGTGFTLHHGLNSPALVTGHWLGFNDLNLITNLTADLIMGFHACAGENHLFIKRMAILTGDLHHDGLGHFIAGNHTGHSTTIIHYAPSTAARLASRKTVSMRAMLERKTFKLLVSVN